MKLKKVNDVMGFIGGGIFYDDVFFGCGCSYNEIIEYFKEIKATSWIKGLEIHKETLEGEYKMIALSVDYNGEHLYYIISKESFVFNDKHYVYLAHECLHICQFYLPNVLDRNKEYESEAYFHSHLMTQCLKMLRG